MARLDLVTLEDLESFKVDMLGAIKELLIKGGNNEVRQWMRSADVRRMLGISPGTLQNMRISGNLAFTKVGGTMFYRISDVEQMLSDENKGKRNGR